MTLNRHLIIQMVMMIALCHSSLSFAHVSKVQSPEALAKTSQYYDSGQYFRDISQKINEAKDYLDEQLQEKSHDKLAIVLDVDETALSNYHNLKRMHFTGNTEAYTGGYLLGDLPPIESVLQLYEHALKNNIAVFFITGRPNTPEIHSATVMNLKRAGYHTWQGIYLRPTHDDEVSVERYKMLARKDISKKGFEVVLNVGDQISDLMGGYAQAQIKLPNPFYYITS